MKTVQDVERIIELSKNTYVSVGLVPKLKLPSHPSENVPVIHFDQFVTMAYQHLAAKNDTEPWKDPFQPPEFTPDLVLCCTEAWSC